MLSLPIELDETHVDYCRLTKNLTFRKQKVKCIEATLNASLWRYPFHRRVNDQT